MIERREMDRKSYEGDEERRETRKFVAYQKNSSTGNPFDPTVKNKN